MRLFIAINLNDEMKDALMDIQDTMRTYGVRGRETSAEEELPEHFGASMRVGHISLMRSDRGKHGMIYTEL